MPIKGVEMQPVDDEGRFINPGLYAYATLDTNFIGGVLPDWLEVPAVTGQNTEGAVTSFGNRPGARSNVRVASAARGSAQAKLAVKLPYAMDSNLEAGCLFELDGLRFESDSAILAVGVDYSGGRGVYVQQVPGDTTAVMRWASGAGSQVIPWQFRGGGAATSTRNIKLYARFRDASVFVFVNDQCVGFVENLSNFGHGTIAPSVSITTNSSGNVVALNVARARLTVYGS